MKGLLDKAIIREIGARYADDFTLPFTTVFEEVDVSKPKPYPYLHEYELRLTIISTFRANSAQRKHAAEQAKMAIQHHVFGGCLSLLHQALSAVEGGDRRAAVKALCQLKTEMVGS